MTQNCRDESEKINNPSVPTKCSDTQLKLALLLHKRFRMQSMGSNGEQMRGIIASRCDTSFLSFMNGQHCTATEVDSFEYRKIPPAIESVPVCFHVYANTQVEDYRRNSYQKMAERCPGKMIFSL